MVEAVDKKRARLNGMHHLLTQMTYQEAPRPAVELPPRERRPDYHRRPVPEDMKVPGLY